MRQYAGQYDVAQVKHNAGKPVVQCSLVLYIIQSLLLQSLWLLLGCLLSSELSTNRHLPAEGLV